MSCLFVYFLLKQLSKLTTMTMMNFLLKTAFFPTAKKPESYRYVSISDTLTSEQRDEVKMWIKQSPDVMLSLPDQTDRIQHDIKLLTSESIRKKGYFITYKTRSVMETEIEDILDLGVIEPSTSTYSSSIVLVQKMDGSVQFCIDFRKLNKVTMQNQFRRWKKLSI